MSYKIEYVYLKQWIKKDIYVLGRYRVDEIEQFKEFYEWLNPTAEYMIEDKIIEGDIVK